MRQRSIEELTRAGLRKAGVRGGGQGSEGGWAVGDMALSSRQQSMWGR